MTEDFSLSQSLLLLVSQLLLRLLLLCGQEAGVTHGGECGGPVPEAGMLRWGCSSSLRGHTASCEWQPEAHRWGLGGICTDGTADSLLHSCEPSVLTLWTGAFRPLVRRSPRFVCSAPSGPAGAGVMAREHLLFHVHSCPCQRMCRSGGTWALEAEASHCHSGSRGKATLGEGVCAHSWAARPHKLGLGRVGELVSKAGGPAAIF